MRGISSIASNRWIRSKDSFPKALASSIFINRRARKTPYAANELIEYWLNPYVNDSWIARRFIVIWRNWLNWYVVRISWAINLIAAIFVFAVCWSMLGLLSIEGDLKITSFIEAPPPWPREMLNKCFTFLNSTNMSLWSAFFLTDSPNSARTASPASTASSKRPWADNVEIKFKKDGSLSWMHRACRSMACCEMWTPS